MHTPSYSDVIAALRQTSIPVLEIGSNGSVAITLAAGRVIAMAFRPDDTNLLWSHPHLGNSRLVAENPGGFGGDRLWFAPELHYNWRGRPDWQSFSNYATSPEMDPGSYALLGSDSRSVTMRARGKLPVQGTDERVGFDVTRTIRIVTPPLSPSDPLMSGVDYVGIETDHVLNISDDTRKGLIDLWHLLQMPPGSVLIVPLNKAADREQRRPLSYGLPGSWVERPDHIEWRYTGEARAKFGLSAAALTGRSAVFRELAAGRWCMIVRDFLVNPQARYCDHPHGNARTDQVFQAWDGFGFGEMEYHSPAADAELGPRVLQDVDRLWAFGGRPDAIAKLATRLLEVDVSHLFREGGSTSR